jgi:signal peptidase I
MILDAWWKIALLVGVLATLRLTVPFMSRVPSNFRSTVVEFLDSAIMALALVFLIIKPFIVQAFWIPSDSMVPTLQRNDRILVNKFVYHFREPQRGDVVVFQAPPRALSMSFGDNHEKKDFIKRVVGLPGDEIKVHEGEVSVNGKTLKEPYISEAPPYEFPEGGDSYKVPKGSLFVLGDNRPNSNDSHRWGPLPRNRLLGKAFIIFWPPGRWKLLEGGSRAVKMLSSAH